MKKTYEIGQQTVLFAGLLLVAIAGFAGYLYGKVAVLEKNGGATAVQPAPQQPGAVQVTMDQIKKLFNDKNLAFGDKNSKVLFVEFSDPSCPFCHVAAGKNSELNKMMDPQTNRFMLTEDGGTYVAPVVEMKKLVDAGKAGFVFLYANGHGNGELATKALYCAKDQGKFWEAHDLLMSNKAYDLINEEVKNDKTKAQVLADFLKGAVDSKKLKDCLDGGKYDGKLAEDMQIAQEFGFNGTPSFFVNTQNFAGAYSYTDMKSAVEEALK